MISLFFLLIIIGVALYLVNQVIPMVPWMKTVINCLAAILVLIYLLQVFGIDTGIRHLRFR